MSVIITTCFAPGEEVYLVRGFAKLDPPEPGFIPGQRCHPLTGRWVYRVEGPFKVRRVDVCVTLNEHFEQVEFENDPNTRHSADDIRHSHEAAAQESEKRNEMEAQQHEERRQRRAGRA